MTMAATNREGEIATRRGAAFRAALREIHWPGAQVLRRAGVSVAWGTAAVVVITLAAFRFHLNLTTAALLHLIVVVLIARQSGFWEASGISVIAVVCQLYFLVPPVFTFVVADPQNWIALAAFEYCALVVSSLSGQATRQTLVAMRRREETEGLYEISRLILLMDRGQAPGLQIAAMIQRVFHCESAGVFDAESTSFAVAGLADPGLEKRTKDTYIGARDRFDDSDHTWFCVLRMGVRPVGALALRGRDIGEPLARAIASLVAVALERSHSFEKESRAEAARQGEQLRTAVLDALAHDVKTPLTAIRAASSGLLEVGAMPPGQTELVTLIDNEAGRLDEITNRLLGMARLDEREVRLKPRSLRLDLLIRRAVAAFETRAPGRLIRASGLADHMIVAGDDQMLGMGLAQLIDNAVKYSVPNSAIAICAERSDSEIMVSVNNLGAVIPPADLERIFERFFRAAGTSQRVPGTGLGLSITRKIAAAHGGRVWATSNAGEGTTFFLALPAISPPNP
jgi:two-component system, OmpR family, sensor histidine kinase KdpD